MRWLFVWFVAGGLLGSVAVDARGGGRPPKKPDPAAETPKPEPPPGGTVTISARKDQLVLTDGKVVRGSIIAAGRRAVIIVTADGERTVPRRRVARIERARPTASTIQPRTYETIVEDGHERIVVPPGLEEEEGEEHPPGLVPVSGGREQAAVRRVGLRYKPKKGSVVRARIEVTREDVEDLPGKPRTSRTETCRVLVTQTITAVTAAGMWTVTAAFDLQGLVRDYKDVTALEAKEIRAARLIRSLSPAGRWQPRADQITGAGKNARRLREWLGYLLVPVPERPARLGAYLNLPSVVPAAIAQQMLPPPRGVSVPNWSVTGTYSVRAVGTVGGAHRAGVTIELKGSGSGNGAYRKRQAILAVRSDATWKIDFDLDLGRVVRTSVSSLAVITGKTPGGKLNATRKLTATLDAGPAVQSGPTASPKPKNLPPKPKRTGLGNVDFNDVKKHGDLDKDLDKLLRETTLDPERFKVGP